MTLPLNQDEFNNFVLNNDKGFYVICAAKLNNNVTEEQRCDANQWGPSVALTSGDERNKETFGSTILTHVNQIENYRVVYAFPPHGYIIHLVLREHGVPGRYDINTEKKLIDDIALSCTAKTFGDLIKLIIEWSRMKENPWNNNSDPLVEICSKFLEVTGIPEYMIEDIDSRYSDMQVYKFLKGNEAARKSNPEGNVIDAELVDIMANKIPVEYPPTVFPDDE
jgi:hypothetical protein